MNIIVEVIAEEGAKSSFAAVDALGQPTDPIHYPSANLSKKRCDPIEWALGIIDDGNVHRRF